KVEQNIESIQQKKLSEEELSFEAEKIRKGFVSHISYLFKVMSAELKFFESQIANDILYGIIALCDEILIEKEWFGKKHWQNLSLEKSFFDSTSSGDVFYEKVEKIISSSDYKYAEVAHIYYLCICCGFEGKYHIEVDKVKKEIIKQRLFEFYSNWLNIKNDKLEINLKFKNKEFKRLASVIHFGLTSRNLILINIIIFITFITLYGIFWDIFVYILEKQIS
ncbi:MAG: DotU family type IV/VI secretion system protein, partial [Silvanigrellaceae bacterium]|nr:DotU family type IV/VI secretion system protein [Silvanigrellaceae bacterium]